MGISSGCIFGRNIDIVEINGMLFIKGYYSVSNYLIEADPIHIKTAVVNQVNP